MCVCECLFNLFMQILRILLKLALVVTILLLMQVNKSF